MASGTRSCAARIERHSSPRARPRQRQAGRLDAEPAHPLQAVGEGEAHALDQRPDEVAAPVGEAETDQAPRACGSMWGERSPAR